LSPLQSRAVIAIPESISSIVIARSANVIVLRASKPKFMVMQVPGGKIINSFDAPAEAYRPPTLSPNGRVLAMPIGNSALWLIDTETGVTLWKTTKFSDVTAWLPEVAATVLSGTGNSARCCWITSKPALSLSSNGPAAHLVGSPGCGFCAICAR
jgi:WD40 repeat protein